jgi:hypothetical protein
MARHSIGGCSFLLRLPVDYGDVGGCKRMARLPSGSQLSNELKVVAEFSTLSSWQ